MTTTSTQEGDPAPAPAPDPDPDTILHSIEHDLHLVLTAADFRELSLVIILILP